MNNAFCRSKIVFLLLLVIPSGAFGAISPRTKMMLVDATYSCGTQVVGLFFKNVMRKQLLQQIDCYSADELARVKQVIEPYVSTDTLNDILSCIRRPKPLTLIEATGSCCFDDVIVIDPKIFGESKGKTLEQIALDSYIDLQRITAGIYKAPCSFTDVECAYIVLHEYGHKINHHYTTISDVISALKVCTIQMPLVALRAYVPNMKYRTLITLWLSGQSATIGHSFFERKKEFAADDYAFNVLKIDAPVGCIALEKLYKQLSKDFVLKADDKPSIGNRFLMTIADRSHPTIWSRYQHACRVAAKYGWTQK